MIYILENVENFYKIGYTKDLEQRLKQLGTGNSSDLTVIKTFDTKYDSKIEAYLKKYFKSNNIKGEWFNFSKEEIEKIETIIMKKEKTFDFLKASDNPFFNKI